MHSVTLPPPPLRLNSSAGFGFLVPESRNVCTRTEREGERERESKLIDDRSIDRLMDKEYEGACLHASSEIAGKDCLPGLSVE
mmetsp:Transcript_46285/g.91271  ORF Transcript_46285/g.91271 Transcript_46285/m.91271 type:complete len:83 (-) Transcript_46285:973-1221(-)